MVSVWAYHFDNNHSFIMSDKIIIIRKYIKHFFYTVTLYIFYTRLTMHNAE